MVYKIVRWDSIEQNNKIVPMIYFKPCLKILNIMKLNNNKIQIKISDTQIYDGIYNGVINKSDVVPNCRPNFFDATNLYVIILNTNFIRYPNLGQFGSFIVNPDLIKTPVTKTLPPQSKCDTPRECKTQPECRQQPECRHYQTPPQNPSRSQLPVFKQNPPRPSRFNGLEIGLIVALIFVLLILIFGGGWAYQKINKRKK